MLKEIKPFSRNKIKKRIYQIVGSTEKSVSEVIAELCEATKLGKRQITHFIENSGRQPRIEEIVIISQILECTIEDLIEYEQAQEADNETSDFQ